MPIDWAALAAPFPASEIEWRVQRSGEKDGKPWAMVLCYVTNRAIMNRLDEIVGPENWQNSFAVSPGGGVLCGITIRIDDGREVTKYDGAGGTDVESEKGSLSGAMKRAAVQWGVGRYLYNLDEGFANIHANGRFMAKTKEGKQFKWDPPPLPAWALPQPKTRNRVQAEHEALCEFIRSVGATIDEGTTAVIGGASRDIKQYIRENWNAIREKYALADSVRSALEEATGAEFKHSPAAA